MQGIAEVEKLAVEISPDTPPERCAEIWDRMLAFDKEWRRVKELAKQALIERGGGFEIGTVRYYVGTEKKIRLRDAAEAVRMLLELLGPDGLAKLLASDGIKHGAARAALQEIDQEEVWQHLFDVEFKEDLKTGKAAKALLSVDERFTKGANK